MIKSFSVKKIFSSLVAAIILCTSIGMPKVSALSPAEAVSTSYAGGKYYQELCEVVLTGDYATDIVNIAKSQIGYHEGNNADEYHGANTSGGDNYTEYGRWAINDNRAWCGYFVTWCAHQARIPDEIVISSKTNPNRGNGLYMHDWYSDLEIFSCSFY